MYYRILITTNKHIHVISAYFLAAASDKHMCLLTSRYGNQTCYTVNEYQNHRLHSAINCLSVTSATDNYATNYASLLFGCEKVAEVKFEKMPLEFCQNSPVHRLMIMILLL